MKKFEEIDLITPLRKALADEAYETPTPIQAQTIPVAIKGRDVLGCAQTGTGKTAAFALPMLNALGGQNRKSRRNQPFALVLAPTRELAIQIGDSLHCYGKYLRLRHAVVYGGVSQVHQARALDRGVHLLVATPGRLLDLMNQGIIDLSQLEYFVLDEADRMLDMGFLPDLKRIIRALPEQRQSLFFSATLPPSIVELAQSLLTDPVAVDVTPPSSSLESIEQQVVYLERPQKMSVLRAILNRNDVDRVLVFTRTKRMANTLAERLQRSGVRVAAIHGDKSQNARQRALQAFRAKQVQVLVATDVAARGIDIDGISHVINYDIPVDPESYVHRIGRTGRAGADGIAMSFCSPHEKSEFRAIEKLIGHRVPVARDRLTGEAASEFAKRHEPEAPKTVPPRKSKPTGKAKARTGNRTAKPQVTNEAQPKRRRKRRKRQPALAAR